MSNLMISLHFNVSVSLWAIDDEATMEFMKVFYQHLVYGQIASEALNKAMKSMRESDRFSAVKYWAPFVLIGDDVRLEFEGIDSIARYFSIHLNLGS